MKTKSLGQIAYETYWKPHLRYLQMEWAKEERCFRREWKKAASAVAREVRKRARKGDR